MPAKLRDFLTSALTLPAWTDDAAIGRAQKFLSDHVAATALMEIMFVVPERARYSGEVQVLHGAVGPHDSASAAGKADRFVTSLATPGSNGPTGDLLVNALKVRLVHAAVRHLLLAQTPWDSAAYGPPISQIYLLAEWSLLTVSVGDTLAKVGAGMSQAQAADFLHTWRVLGTVMGLTADAMATTWADARHLAQVVDARYAVVGPAVREFLPAAVTGTLPATGNPLFPTALATDLVSQAFRRCTGRGQERHIEIPTSLYQPPT
jgi:hypothetical protein